MRHRLPVLRTAIIILIAAALASCLEEECITVIVENNRDEAVVIFETECWSLDVTIPPGQSGNIFVLPGEVIDAEDEVSGTKYTHIFSTEYDTWVIN